MHFPKYANCNVIVIAKKNPNCNHNPLFLLFVITIIIFSKFSTKIVIIIMFGFLQNNPNREFS